MPHDVLWEGFVAGVGVMGNGSAMRLLDEHPPRWVVRLHDMWVAASGREALRAAAHMAVELTRLEKRLEEPPPLPRAPLFEGLVPASGLRMRLTDPADPRWLARVHGAWVEARPEQIRAASIYLATLLELAHADTETARDAYRSARNAAWRRELLLVRHGVEDPLSTAEAPEGWQP